jgi:hypothetical protein
MSVNELGKLNVYEYVYFLTQHARRHLTQMQDNHAEWLATPLAAAWCETGNNSRHA